ncbi:MAG: SMP-30/gluconolactonase/LRE family protein, partial [Myxococcales bacterium]
DDQTLILGGQSGVKKYTIASGMVAMTGASFGPSEVTQAGVNADGMTMDCAGNLYVAVAGGTTVYVVKPDGSKLGTITLPSGAGQANVSNVAFGGTDHKTLYVTAQGAGKGQGVFKVQLNFPGRPF